MAAQPEFDEEFEFPDEQEAKTEVKIEIDNADDIDIRTP